MKLKRLLALLMAFGLSAAACGGSSGSEEGDDTSTETTEEGAAEETTTSAAPAEEAPEAAEEIAVDFGVTDTEIRVGLNADLSGPFAALVSEIVESQKVYWEFVNENGGIAGRDVVPIVLDSGYDTAKGIENYSSIEIH